jgi:hypothetical protein
MCRSVITPILIVISTIILLSHQATAFTLRLSPVASPASALAEGQESDVPTPQLFQVGVAAGGVTLGTASPSDGFRAPEPVLQFEGHPVVSPANKATPTQHASQQVESPSTAPQLSGVELLLLRKTSVVAGH